MRNFAKIFLFAVFFACFFDTSVMAGSASIDKSNISDGVVGVKYTGSFSKDIKITVEKNSDRYIYTVKTNDQSYVPLQMGTGTYKISVLENVSGDKYKPIFSESVKLDKMPPVKMYTYSTFETFFKPSMKSVKNYDKLVEGKDTDDKVKTVYNDVIKNYVYDYQKIKSLPSNYIPDIEDMYAKKKGICYDYSALMSGVLRNQGVPTKLVKGYAPNIKEYHAWNEIYLNGKWVVVDTTSDAAYVQAGHKVEFAKRASDFKVLKFY